MNVLYLNLIEMIFSWKFAAQVCIEWYSENISQKQI